MRKIYLMISVLTLLLHTGVYAQVIIKSNTEFKLEVDVARFYADSTQVYLEMYYGIRENMLAYVLDSGQYVGKANLKWEIRQNSYIVADKDWYITHIIDSSKGFIRPQILLGLQSVALPPGDYTIHLLCADVNDTTRRDSFVTPLNIVSYPTDREFLSDIEFCTSIQASTDKQSLFYKNTLEVLPNPSRLYGSGLPIMYYYTTAYNLLKNSNQKNVIVRTSVIDASGKEIIANDKTKPRLYNSSVEVGTVNLTTLKTGTFLFRVSLLDSLKNILTATDKRFFIYKYGSIPDSSLNPTGSDFIGSKYAILSEKDLDNLFNQARYIASGFERDQYDKLTELKAKQNFLYDFWKRRATDRQTQSDKVEEAYYKRVEYANEQFTSGFREGWKTDRGRIYIFYGQYDEIERFPSTSESNPYEIWHYPNIQGGVIFIFVDRDALGNYILAHSTHRDELHDQDWYNHYAIRMR